MTDISSLTLSELESVVIEGNYPKYRAKQIFEWLHNKFADSFDQMSNLPKDLREWLNGKYVITSPKVIEKLYGKSGTVKYLLEFDFGTIIECVFLKQEYGNTVCVSTQAGCRMGCVFCASGAEGLVRSLTPSEILCQVYAMSRLEGRVTNVVIMGMGEPLDNYENVMRFIELLNSPDGLNIGMRHITLSTCGLVNRINDLAEKRLQLTLAISLHAPTDEIRRKFMPIANKYGIDELLESAANYANITKRRVTFEYALIDGMNDSKECAIELSRRLRGILCNVNIIPMNKTGVGSLHEGSASKVVSSFVQELMARGVEATVRPEKGADIEAACGQLYLKKLNSEINNQ